MSMSSSRSGHLSTAECWALLERERIGRLALNDARGAPDIFPVNFIAYEGSVYIRTAPDIKLTRLAADHAAAFEIDGHDEAGAWSVVARGTAARVTDEVEIARSGVARLVTASPRFTQHVLKVTPTAVTGRRFADRIDPREAAHEWQGRSRPTAIPARPPLTVKNRPSDRDE